MRFHSSFTQAYQQLKDRFRGSHLVHTERWQGLDISKRPEAAMHELLFESFTVPIETEDLDGLRADIKPNLPWADNHFLERVCGSPINPGVEWKNWPYAHSASGHLDNGGRFNHNYMERYWPRYAGLVSTPTSTAQEFLVAKNGQEGCNWGIRHPYGDLGNLVMLLLKEPLTRQAYMPIFFPEDTGDIHDGRKPCTLGYHFIVRDGKLHVVYYIRSCDFIRHYSDDVYLTVRLLLWILDQCREIKPSEWRDIKPGNFVMHITSLHMFRNDYISLFGGDK